jgi:hypothetical protein
MSGFDLRVRLSFPGLSSSLSETAKAMEEWALASARVLAPELRWTTEVRQRGEETDDTHWSSTHVVRLHGTARDGARRGRGEVRLAAGGDMAQMGGNGLVEIEALGPTRYLVADNHCDVTHWDVVACAVDDAQIESLARALESTLGRRAERGGERRDPIARSAQVVGHAASEDAALWIEDLDAVGLGCRGHAGPDGRVMVMIEHADLEEILDLEEARVTLGEVLGEAGHEDWYERARALLARLPDASR